MKLVEAKREVRPSAEELDLTMNLEDFGDEPESSSVVGDESTMNETEKTDDADVIDQPSEGTKSTAVAENPTESTPDELIEEPEVNVESTDQRDSE